MKCFRISDDGRTRLCTLKTTKLHILEKQVLWCMKCISIKLLLSKRRRGRGGAAATAIIEQEQKN